MADSASYVTRDGKRVLDTVRWCSASGD